MTRRTFFVIFLNIKRILDAVIDGRAWSPTAQQCFDWIEMVTNELNSCPDIKMGNRVQDR